MKKVVFVEPKTVSPKDKEKLNKNGILVIEHPHPDQVRMYDSTNDIEPNVLFMSALKGLMGGSISKMDFVDELYRRLKDKEKSAEKQPKETISATIPPNVVQDKGATNKTA